MSRTYKDSRALSAMSPNAREHAEAVQVERESLRRWREDVRAGRALPAAGDLLASVQAVGMPEPRNIVAAAPGWQPDLFGGDLFDGVQS